MAESPDVPVSSETFFDRGSGGLSGAGPWRKMSQGLSESVKVGVVDAWCCAKRAKEQSLIAHAQGIMAVDWRRIPAMPTPAAACRFTVRAIREFVTRAQKCRHRISTGDCSTSAVPIAFVPRRDSSQIAPAAARPSAHA